MELYLHIPFCARKCRYCDFASYTGRHCDMPQYVDALLAEADTYARLPDESFETVFIGGGTPSLLPPTELDRLLDGIRKRFTLAADVEFTSEANPGTLTEEWLGVAAKHGVNRLSLGMQAYQPKLLAMLGRIHDFRQVTESVRMAHNAGITNISLDLMFGLPGQTETDWNETMEAAISLKPQHLSCYGLIPEDGTPLKQELDAGTLTLPDEETERRMYDATLCTLAAHGYEQYEISNFAQPGYTCRHNIGYWTQVPYLGLGCAASSMLPDISGKCRYMRISNPPALDDYLTMMKQGDSVLRMSEQIAHNDACFETLMLGLRMTCGVSESAYYHLHSESIDSRYGDVLRRLESDGLLDHTDGFWRLTRRGMDVQNMILVELMET